MNEPGGQELKSIIEDRVKEVPKYLTRSTNIYKMSRHYWHDILGEDFVEKEDFKVASLGAEDNTEAFPFAFALEGKGEDELRRFLLRVVTVRREGEKNVLVKPEKPKIQIFGFDYETNLFHRLRKNFLLKNFSNPKRFIQSDLRNIPTRDEVFDVCLIRNPYWDELGKTGEVGKVFSEFNRVLKSGGILWMTFLSEDEYKTALDILKSDSKYQIKFAGESEFQTAPGINPETGQPWPWDKFILLAKKQ